jgi:TRAP-type mannitol/chloroaromatic compound transport system substrate-binding protein
MMPTSRREFLTRAGLLAVGASLSALAFAHTSPEVHWTTASASQPSLDVIHGGAGTCAAPYRTRRTGTSPSHCSRPA